MILAQYFLRRRLSFVNLVAAALTAYVPAILLADASSAATNTRRTLYLIGDSTVNTPTKGQQGWGTPIGNLFDTSRINVLNKARGGRSSRTYYTENLWEEVRSALQPGDFVLMQFGHNDGGPIADGRARASLKGNGEETQDIENKTTRKNETVHTYGWYLRTYIKDAKAAGATPIVLSPIPRNIWKDGKVLRANNDYGKWAAEAARTEGALFVDLNGIIAGHYDEIGQVKVKENFFTTADHTHTTPAGAEFNAGCVVEGIHSLNGCTLKLYVRTQTADGHKLLKCINPDPDTGMSDAVIVDDSDLVHTTQILPSDTKADARKQTDEVLSKLDKILRSAGAKLDDACKLNICISSDEGIKPVRQALSARFAGQTGPAVTIAIGKLAVADAVVAMDAVAAATPPLNGLEHELEHGMRSCALLPKGPKIYVSGMADTNALPKATRKTLEKLVAAIGHLGLDKKDIVQLKAFLEPMSDAALVRKEIVDFFDSNAPPLVFVEWISPKPNPPIEIELIARAKGDFSNETNSVTFLTPPGTTDSRVFRRVARVNHGRLIYISGLYGEITGDGGVQIREIFRSLKGVLQQSGSDLDHLVKATYYVSDEDAGNKLNEIRPQFYKPDRPPAASKAKIRSVGMPEKTVTLDMIAVTKK